jgi:hypothetical protein
MTFLGRLRRRQPVAARWLTALFAVAWLGLAVQPCSAMDSPDHAGDGSHMPATGDAAHDCPHCPSPAEPGTDLPCGNALSCDAVGAPAVPSKAADVQPVDLVILMSLPVAAVPASAPGPGPLRPPCLVQRRTPTSTLQQRYCSFLK